MKALRKISPIFLLFPLALALGCQPQPQERIIVNRPQAEKKPREMVVLGSGESVTVPDQALVNFGIRVQANSAKKARNSVDRQMKAVIEAVATYGVAKEDVQTRNVSLHDERYGRMSRPPRFVASNRVTVVVKHLDKLGDIIGAVTEAGVNQMHGVSFGLQNPKPHKAKARQAAVKDAQTQAQEIARHAGVRLGKVLSIRGGDHEQNFISGRFGHRHAAAVMMQSAAPVESGSLEVHQKVEIRYEITDE